MVIVIIPGKLYDNIFLHFKPLGGESVWYKEEDMAAVLSASYFTALPALTAGGVRDAQEALSLGPGSQEDWSPGDQQGDAFGTWDPPGMEGLRNNPRFSNLKEMFRNYDRSLE